MDKTIGQIAYEAYCVATEKKTPMPWDDLTATKPFWEAAATAVENLSITRVHELMAESKAKDVELEQLRRSGVSTQSLGKPAVVTDMPVRVIQ